MKNNTQNCKEYLIRAIQNLPNDNALQEVRAHLMHALQTIENVETKRSKRNNNQIQYAKEEKEKSLFYYNSLTPRQGQNALKELDKMIELENKKIAQNQETQGDISTILG